MRTIITVLLVVYVLLCTALIGLTGKLLEQETKTEHLERIK